MGSKFCRILNAMNITTIVRVKLISVKGKV